MTPDPSKGLEVFSDTDFCRLFNPETALYDPVNAKSRTGYIIKYMDFLIVWASKLQTETTLSTCEAEYMACSEALLVAIPLMNLIDEATSFGIPITPDKARIYCKLFCDNTGAVELLKLPKVQPQTKHINMKLHHFQEHVVKGLISIWHVPTTEQLADIRMKPLAQKLFEKFCKCIMGW